MPDKLVAEVVVNVIMWKPWVRLEGAPVPSTGDAGSDIATLAESGSKSLLRVLVLKRVDGLGRCLLSGRLDGLVLGVDLALDPVQALRAGFFPALVGNPTEVAGPRLDALGMEARILVERDAVGSVRRAEDVATVATVMTAQEETERRAAGRRVAVGRSRVRLLQGVVSIIRSAMRSSG